MELTKPVDAQKLQTIRQLLDLDKPEIWQKIEDLLKTAEWTAKIEHKLGTDIQAIAEKTDITKILQTYQKPQMNKIVGILPKDEPLNNWLQQID